MKQLGFTLHEQPSFKFYASKQVDRVHSRFFVNLINLVGWASPTKHLVHVAYFLVGDAHPTPYGKAALPLQFYTIYPVMPFVHFFTKNWEYTRSICSADLLHDPLIFLAQQVAYPSNCESRGSSQAKLPAMRVGADFGCLK
ncbi:MAG: hypothetical protein HUU08_07975 [Candidatus Brocadia sp.]|nr:hypothetical protein [Candidatus Brocadia sp.]